MAITMGGDRWTEPYGWECDEPEELSPLDDDYTANEYQTEDE